MRWLAATISSVLFLQGYWYVSGQECNQTQTLEWRTQCFEESEKRAFSAADHLTPLHVPHLQQRDADVRPAAALCASIQAKLHCISLHGSCEQGDDIVLDLQLGFLHEQYQSLRQSPHFNTLSNLGFFEWCPSFDTFERDYVAFITGDAERCTYQNLLKLGEEKTICVEKANAQKDFMLHATRFIKGRSGRNIRELIFCQTHDRWNGCMKQFLKCFSPDGAARLREEDEKAMANIELLFDSLFGAYGKAKFQFKHCYRS